MVDDENIPEGIGPHEGKELELMLAGEKPAAMFSDVIPPSFDFPEDLFAAYVVNGTIVRRDVVITVPVPDRHDMRYLFYALPGEEWRIDRLEEIHRALHQRNEPTSTELETETGQLLGYEDRDIQTYLQRSFPSLS